MKSVFFIILYCHFSVSIGHTWKMIKPHIAAIIQDVIFPLMCHSECDQELWESDPQEYISQKFGTIKFFKIFFILTNDN